MGFVIFCFISWGNEHYAAVLWLFVCPSGLPPFNNYWDCWLVPVQFEGKEKASQYYVSKHLGKLAVGYRTEAKLVKKVTIWVQHSCSTWENPHGREPQEAQEIFPKFQCLRNNMLMHFFITLTRILIKLAHSPGFHLSPYFIFQQLHF